MTPGGLVFTTHVYTTNKGRWVFQRQWEAWEVKDLGLTGIRREYDRQLSHAYLELNPDDQSGKKIVHSTGPMVVLLDDDLAPVNGLNYDGKWVDEAFNPPTEQENKTP